MSEEKRDTTKRKYQERKVQRSKFIVVYQPPTGIHDSPVTQVRLDGKQIFVEALDGFFLKYEVDPSSSIQHPHFNLRLLCLLFWP